MQRFGGVATPPRALANRMRDRSRRAAAGHPSADRCPGHRQLTPFASTAVKRPFRALFAGSKARIRAPWTRKTGVDTRSVGDVGHGGFNRCDRLALARGVLLREGRLLRQGRFRTQGSERLGGQALGLSANPTYKGTLSLAVTSEAERGWNEASGVAKAVPVPP